MARYHKDEQHDSKNIWTDGERDKLDGNKERATSAGPERPSAAPQTFVEEEDYTMNIQPESPGPRRKLKEAIERLATRIRKTPTLPCLPEHEYSVCGTSKKPFACRTHIVDLKNAPVRSTRKQPYIIISQIAIGRI